jgi:prepilin-type N-terminal cleavage/methylation domain-containing protein
MVRRNGKENGFTLVEVLAGTILLSVGLLLLMPLMVVSMQGNELARGSTDSSMLIREKIEELKNIDNPVSGVDTTGASIRTWNVTAITTNLRRLQVRVDWLDRDGHSRTNSMVTYLMSN